MLKCPSDWLQEQNLEIMNVPGLSSDEFIQDTVLKSHIVVLVTDSVRCLSAFNEKFFLSEFLNPSKPHLMILVNHIPNTMSLQELESTLDEKLREFDSKKDDLSIFYVPLNDSSSPDAIADLSALKDKISLHSQKKTLFHDAETFALSRKLSHQALLLHSLSKSFAGSLETVFSLRKDLENQQEKLDKDFQTQDLPILKDALKNYTMSVRDYLDKFFFWKLFYKSDEIGTDLKYHLRLYPFTQGQLQVLFHPSIFNFRCLLSWEN